MKILVTGGLGLIGTSLSALLQADDHEITILDNYSRAATSVPAAHWRDVEIIEGDIRALADVEQAAKGKDAVIHLAAYGSVIESLQSPQQNFEVNAQGTLNVLQAAVDASIEKFIFASTGGAILGNATPPVNEATLPKPISPYGASKLCGEAYCNAFAASYGISTVATRFANIYGPYSAHKQGAITLFIRAAIESKPIHIYGDGSATRDFLYVDDLCKGLVLALGADMKGSTVLHLASGVETSVAELAKKILAICDAGADLVSYLPARKGEVERNFADYQLAQRLLGFTPATALDDGLAQTVQWFRQVLCQA